VPAEPILSRLSIHRPLRHHLPVLAAGTTINRRKKIPQAVNLNCWPTSFFIARDGLVKETQRLAGAPGKLLAISAGHDVTDFVEKLLHEFRPIARPQACPK